MKNNNSLKNIGNNIQIARLNKSLTQDAVAEKCNVSAKQISAIERGLSVGSVSLIVDICNLLEVTPNYIFGNTINNSNNSVTSIPNEMSIEYLKLNEDNKKFIQKTIKHLYSMQKKR